MSAQLPESGSSDRTGPRLRIFADKQDIEVSIDHRAWVAAACDAAGRNLTAEESAVLLPGEPVRPTCPTTRGS